LNKPSVVPSASVARATVNTIDWVVYLITDRHATRGRPLPDVVGEAVRGAGCAVQLREHDLPTRALLDLASRLRECTARAGAAFLINDRLDLCWAVGADGVHLRHDSLPTHVVRRLLGPEKLIGVSVHSLTEAKQAEADGADFVLFGPVYPTPSKAAYGPPQGLDRLAEVTRGLRIPVFAVGGVTAARAGELVRAGARGVGVITAVFGADDVSGAAAAMLDAVGNALSAR
jgi:thiamine-phosphate pyrophosphorylase